MDILGPLKRWGWVAWTLQIGVLCYWLLDREAPFKVISYAEPVPAAPGEFVQFRIGVKRDLTRGCDVNWSRHLLDGAGVRFDYGGRQLMSEASLSAMERASPNEIKLAFMVPTAATPGRALYTTVLEYRCNPLHSLWPIVVTTEWPFTIAQQEGSKK